MLNHPVKYTELSLTFWDHYGAEDGDGVYNAISVEASNGPVPEFTITYEQGVTMEGPGHESNEFTDGTERQSIHFHMDSIDVLFEAVSYLKKMNDERPKQKNLPTDIVGNWDFDKIKGDNK